MDQPQDHPELPAGSASDFLAQLYTHLPLLVVRLRPDGMVLGVNEQVTRTTGYGVTDLVGRNWWAVLFPGRLFAQVPRFISPGTVEGVLRDFPMTCRTKDGHERVIAWTRFLRADGAWQELVCVGMDLTDRLTKADLDATEAAPAADAAAGAAALPLPEGSFVEPIAASPPERSDDHERAATIAQVHEFLGQLDDRMGALLAAYAAGESATIAQLAEELRRGAEACGLLPVRMAAQQLQALASRGMVDRVGEQVGALVAMCRRSQRAE